MLINNNKKTNRRLESTKKYIDDLSKKYSKLNVVRVDLGYTKEDSKSITFEDASKDLNKMLNNTRSKPTVFGEMVGYITKKELGEDKGVHIHVAIIYNGNIVREDITKAQQIGEYWKNNITKGKGVFHNCSKNEYKNKAV
ncbi:YagK/YfjJ domain-containing protein, partial [Aliarcobacter butzleri]